MSHQHPSNIPFWILAAISVATASAAVVLTWPHLASASRAESKNLVIQADQTTGPEQQADYQLAAWLSRANHAAFAGLAADQLASGQPSSALDSLRHAGTGSNLTDLKVRTLMELGRYEAAASLAGQLSAANAPDSHLVDACLAYALANQPGNLSNTMARIAAPKAARAAARANAGNLPLAAQLYATGLLNSSYGVLAKLPASYERNVMMARIDYSRPNRSNLLQAEALLNNAIVWQPSGLDARALLITVYRAEGKLPQVQQQQSLLSKLLSGQP